MDLIFLVRGDLLGRCVYSSSCTLQPRPPPPRWTRGVESDIMRLEYGAPLRRVPEIQRAQPSPKCKLAFYR